MKYLAALALSLIVAGSPVNADESARLRVSATIPPGLCVYPDRCDSTIGRPAPAAATRVVVSEARISYVGSPPTVEKKNGLLVVTF